MSKYIKLDETVNALIELNAKLGSQWEAKWGVRLAIGYVKDMPTIEAGDDCISRQAAIEAICKDGTMFERQGKYSMAMAERKQRDIDILEALPSPYKGGDTE